MGVRISWLTLATNWDFMWATSFWAVTSRMMAWMTVSPSRVMACRAISAGKVLPSGRRACHWKKAWPFCVASRIWDWASTTPLWPWDWVSSPS